MIDCKCFLCKKQIQKTNSDFKKTTNHFCSSSCSATYYNSVKPKRVAKPNKQCKNCEKDVLSKRESTEFCSSNCKKLYTFNNGLYVSPISIKPILAEIHGNKCSICNMKPEWHGKPIVFILDHIDGNSQDNMPDNLRLVCPNCDSQLPTYKNKNKGKGRHSRKTRYQQGKSY